LDLIVANEFYAAGRDAPINTFPPPVLAALHFFFRVGASPDLASRGLFF
jgi:hypothetical protein